MLSLGAAANLADDLFGCAKRPETVFQKWTELFDQKQTDVFGHFAVPAHYALGVR